MEPIEIITIICALAIVGGVVGTYIYKRIHKIPTGDCACCALTKKKRLLRQYHKKYSHNKHNCPSCNE